MAWVNTSLLISVTNDFEAVMEKLFTAKWNVPKATEALGKAANKENWEETKALFRTYCLDRPLSDE